MQLIEKIEDYEGGIGADLDGIEDDLSDIFEKDYDQLEKLVETGESSEKFMEKFLKKIRREFDCGGGPYLYIELLTEDEFKDLNLQVENIIQRVDWKERCGDYIKDIENEPFALTTWKWGKLRFIFSGFKNRIG